MKLVLSCRMHRKAILICICFYYAFLPYVFSIDCYACSSLRGNTKACEDTFMTDITTEHLISRDCYYGYWKAHYCIKLKGVREDGSSIVVRQCAVDDWGSHCGLIQFEVGNKVEDIEGCLETCNFDGCNSATMNNYSVCILCSSVMVFLIRKFLR